MISMQKNTGGMISIIAEISTYFDHQIVSVCLRSMQWRPDPLDHGSDQSKDNSHTNQIMFTSLFKNEMFMHDEIFKQNVLKFAIQMDFWIPKVWQILKRFAGAFHKA